MPHARKYGLPRCAPRFPWCYANRVATMFGLDNPFQSKIEMPLHGHILNPGHIFWGTWYIWIFGGRDWYELVLWPKKQNNISFPLEIDQAASAWYPVETMFFFWSPTGYMLLGSAWDSCVGWSLTKDWSEHIGPAFWFNSMGRILFGGPFGGYW